MDFASKLPATPLICLAIFLISVSTAVAAAEGMRNTRTVPVLADPGVNMFRVKAKPRTATFSALQFLSSSVTVNFLPPGTNPDNMGDTCGTWPDAPKAALNFAVAQWQAELNSSVPIVIDACWATSLPPLVLGQSGALNNFRDFTNAPQSNTWYPVALANSIAGTDLAPGSADIYMAFSSTFSWYFGTDGFPPANQYDMVSVALHEICHGLGFLGSMSVSGISGSWGNSTAFPFIYDRFAQNGSGQSLTNTAIFPNPSAALGTQLTSNNVFFSGTNANTANGGSPVKLYAPASWSSGSSFSHLDETFNNSVNALMTFSLANGESLHDPGPVTLGILRDLGWQVTVPPAQFSLSLTINGNGSVNSDPPGIACTGGTCTAPFANGASVSLTASGVNETTRLSHFGNWSGACEGTSSSCNTTMSSDRSITATFITNLPVRVPSTQFFSSLQEAYNAPGTASLSIQSQAVELAPFAFNLDKGKLVTLDGGYDSNYTGPSGNNGGYTTLQGSLTVTTGSISVKNLIIK